jgi:hypothetical protein
VGSFSVLEEVGSFSVLEEVGSFSVLEEVGSFWGRHRKRNLKHVKNFIENDRL